ncbi:MAG: cysteine desulfurase family protein [Patescibacteria group bacterium]
MKPPIYLDYAATTPMDPRVISAMTDVMEGYYGNPSSVHAVGRAAREQIEEARREVAGFFGAKDSSEIVFTSGATESNNLVLRGVVQSSKIKKPHIITTSIEHKAILETLDDIALTREIEVTLMQCDQSGHIDIERLKNEIRHNTILISVMFVNNETGSVQDIRGIGKMLEKLNEGRERAGFPKVLFHTDAVQAVQYYDCRVAHLHVDLLSASAHKVYGPKGIGVLYIKKRLALHPMITGGGQEFEKRAGTENISGIIGFAQALQILAKKKDTDREHVLELKKVLTKGLSSIKGAQVVSTDHGAPHIVSCIFKDIPGDALLVNLDLVGISASTGSACTSGSIQPSHVLLACGFPEDEAKSALRFSLGRWTKKSEVEKLLSVLPGIIEKLST